MFPFSRSRSFNISLIIILALIGTVFFLTVTTVYAGTMVNYGVIFAPESDFASLRIKSSIDTIEYSGSNWQAALDSASENGQKLVLMTGWQDNQVCQGGNGWTWSGSDWSLNSTGTSFMDFIAGYIKGGGQGFLALYTLHEPLNWMHSPNCSTDVQKKLYSMLKREAVNRGLAADQLPLFVDIGLTSHSEFTAGICDYCSTWYYPNGECSGSTFDARLDSCVNKMKSSYKNLEAKSPDSVFVALAQSFGGISGYAMPTASELETQGNRYISELKTNFSGKFMFAWYTWSGQYSITLKTSPGGDASYAVMANVFNANSIPPVASPTPVVYAKGDVNHDGLVNLTDMILILNNFMKSPSQVSGYFDPIGDSKVNIWDSTWVVKEWP